MAGRVAALFLAAAAVCGVAGASQGGGADDFKWPHHGSGEIVLDTRIRDWVLLPIFVIMVFFTMLREIGGRLMNASPKGAYTPICPLARMSGAPVLIQCAPVTSSRPAPPLPRLAGGRRSEGRAGVPGPHVEVLRCPPFRGLSVPQ